MLGQLLGPNDVFPLGGGVYRVRIARIEDVNGECAVYENRLLCFFVMEQDPAAESPNPRQSRLAQYGLRPKVAQARGDLGLGLVARPGEPAAEVQRAAAGDQCDPGQQGRHEAGDLELVRSSGHCSQTVMGVRTIILVVRRSIRRSPLCLGPRDTSGRMPTAPAMETSCREEPLRRRPSRTAATAAWFLAARRSAGW